MRNHFRFLSLNRNHSKSMRLRFVQSRLHLNVVACAHIKTRSNKVFLVYHAFYLCRAHSIQVAELECCCRND